MVLVSKIRAVNYQNNYQNKNNSKIKNNQVNFEGLNVSKPVKKAAIGFTLFAASVLGVSACCSPNKVKTPTNPGIIYTEINEGVEHKLNSHEIKNNKSKAKNYYDLKIDSFMVADKNIKKITTSHNSDNIGKYSAPAIIVDGFDEEGDLLRQVIIHPKNAYYPDRKNVDPAAEYEFIEYLPNKKVTNVEDVTDPLNNYKKIEYYKQVEYDGKPGYYKTEYIYDNLYPGDDVNIARKDVYTKGIVIENAPDGNIYSEDYHRKEYYFNTNNLVIGWDAYKADEQGHLIHDDMNSRPISIK